MFIIQMDKVLTISELDERVKLYYIMNVNNINSDDVEEQKSNELSREMGYLGSVEETKKKLEALFNKS